MTSNVSTTSAFAALSSCLSSELRCFFDALECNQATHRILHMRKGRQQLESYLMMQYSGATSFEQLIRKNSLQWEHHVNKADKSNKLRVQKRQLLSNLLPGLQHVIDIRVGRPGKPDDAVYLEDEYARKWLPRGNCIAKWKDKEMTYCFPLIRGLRKFTGQEDDGELAQEEQKDKHGIDGDLAIQTKKKKLLDNSKLKGQLEKEKQLKFFTKPQSESRWMISTTKENGEAGHLAVLKRSDGDFIYVLGSKNTHLIAQVADDVERTQMIHQKDGSADMFYSAAPIATAILRMLSALEPSKRRLLQEFLWQTRATACFEVLMLNHQHVQSLDYLVENTPVFYGLSLMTLNPLEGAEICVNPVLIFEIMRALGVRTVNFEILEVDGIGDKAAIERTKNDYQVEGCVYLFLDDNAVVIGMQKQKSIWYVCLRAIREKAKTFCRTLISKNFGKDRTAPLSPAEALDLVMESLHKRFIAIKQFLQISLEVSQAYETLGKQFLEYLYQKELFNGNFAEINQVEKIRQVARDVSNFFPIVWKKFLNETGLSDYIVSN
ncbi:uncharacterized protein PHALS_12781 [Plasmopara halstedii]|uniref:DUF7920 domain-containing protein n=1 Tax=Plasmopara halstedii TaxID=4781 RepID=A0A0P1AN50_PLAHL|nr:uncharacterized protein PHALS_12781 [Plasmopara halstedii]CEG42512.1 hypothetical protein PHALS_12781 [Plasmopara halstedii]|eukprot:XP_024578881.1 hypothetical protein PHALS_12781 [Plasmopara halstedii]